jgi:hypothetical protein
MNFEQWKIIGLLTKKNNNNNNNNNNELLDLGCIIMYLMSNVNTTYYNVEGPMLKIKPDQKIQLHFDFILFVTYLGTKTKDE